MRKKILLVKPPFFSPLTPPLGIALIKAFLEKHGYSVRCVDFNTDVILWETHHKYFSALWRNEAPGLGDGYSQLWNVLNAHLLAHLNGANHATIVHLLVSILHTYDIKFTLDIVDSLLQTVERFFARMKEVSAALPLESISAIGTSTYTTSLAPSLFILREAKMRNPRVMTLMGGGVFADDLAYGSENLDTLVREYPYVDHMILGEGEILCLKILEGELSDHRIAQLSDIDGFILPKDDAPLPDFSDFAVEEYHHLTIEGGRSCPFQCQFCSETIQWGKYRRKPGNTLAEQVLRLADQYGQHSFFLGDSLMDPYITDFASELVERNAHILYDGYLRADKLATDRDRALLWRRSGLFRVRMGVESASAAVLKHMQKMTTPQRIAEALKSLTAAGIRTTTYWIAGFPGEMESDFEETLEFIREHHRLIYELEAHPYWYYPYGQVGSRLHNAQSLYSDDITAVIKFKQWEVIDVQPDRREKFRRLRILTKLAGSLGIPNIYTMAQRVDAERRWLDLQPLAREVYPGTRRQYTKLAAAVPSPANPYCRKAETRMSVLQDAFAYAAAAALVDSNCLGSAMAALIEMCGGALGAVDQKIQDNMILYNEEVPTDDASALRRWVAVDLATQLNPKIGRMAIVGLVRGTVLRDEVVLVVHHTAANPRRVVALMEELHRVYRQIEHGGELAPRSSAESLSEIAQNHAANAYLWLPGSDKDWTCAKVSIDVNLSSVSVSLDLTECGVDRVDVIGCAALAAFRAHIGTIWIRTPGLEAGEPSNRSKESFDMLRVAPPSLRGDSDSLHGARSIRNWRVDQTKNACKTHPNEPGTSQLLVDTSFLVDEAWLGGDAWTPVGFITDEPPCSEPFDIVIVPMMDVFGVHLLFGCAKSYSSPGRIEEMSEALVAEMLEVLSVCRTHAKAKRSWRAALPRATIIDRSHANAANSIKIRQSCCKPVDITILNMAAQAVGVDVPSLLLSCCSIVASRVFAREEVLVVMDRMGQGHPLALTVSANLLLCEHAREVNQALQQALDPRARSMEAYTEWVQEQIGSSLQSLFDIGCSIESEEIVSNEGAPIWIDFSSVGAQHILRFSCATTPHKFYSIQQMFSDLFREMYERPTLTVGESALLQRREWFEALKKGFFDFT